MTRIQTHTVDDAPGPARPLPAGFVKTSPTGKLLRLGGQLARSAAVLVAYAAIRKATETYGTLNDAQTPPDLPSVPARQE